MYVKCSFINLRDSMNETYSYEVCACIEFQGTMTSTGESEGHYICDVKTKPFGKWYRTNDNYEPKAIKQSDVSHLPYVVLYRRK